MIHFYINKNTQPTGEREIHKSECSYMPSIINREYLGYFNTFAEAKLEARKKYNNVDGCAHCCPEGHNR